MNDGTHARGMDEVGMLFFFCMCVCGGGGGESET